MKCLSPVDRYFDELLDFGGEPLTRAEVIERMQRTGTPQPLIDRWLQGQERAARIDETRKRSSIRVFIPGSN